MPLPDSAIQSRIDAAYTMRGKEITYSAFSSRTLNTKTGVRSPTFTDSTINEAMVGMLDHVTVKESDGAYRSTDTAFRIRNDDMPETPPSKKSRITFDSVTYSIVDYMRSQNRYEWVIVCREP